jgi:hypothetical protein
MMGQTDFLNVIFSALRKSGEGRVVRLSYLRRSGQLKAFFDRGSSALVDIGGKVDEVYSTPRWAFWLVSIRRIGRAISPRSALRISFPHGEMAKKISAHLIQWHNGSAVVLRHQ